MQAQDIMSRKLVTIAKDENLAVARDLFFQHKFHHLLVVDDQANLVGVITDRDLLKALNPSATGVSARDISHASLNTLVAQVCSTPLVTVTPEMAISQVIDVFKEHAVTCVPVMGQHGRALGIISWRDIINRL